MRKVSEEKKFSSYSAKIKKEFKSYGIYVEQEGPGSMSATFPGGEPVEFLSRSSLRDIGPITGFREPYVEEKNGTLVVDNIQLLPIMKILYKVEQRFGSKPNPKYLQQIDEFYTKLMAAAKDCLQESGAEKLKNDYGVTERELDYIESLQKRLDKIKG